jgi:hypothetical protein
MVVAPPPAVAWKSGNVDTSKFKIRKQEIVGR